jgi:ribosomal protection tetracycline resistance protein
MRTGTLHIRDRLRIGRFGASEREQRRVTAISVFAPGGEVASPAVSAGRIAKVWGLGDVTVGDTVGAPSPTREAFRFAPPSLEAIVAPRNPADRTAMYAALTQLAEQDPLIGLRADRDGQETALSLYGEVQKEVIGDTLAADFGVAVEFRESTTICIERLAGTGSAVVPIPPGRSPEHPLLAGLGLRIEPQPVDSGVQVALEIERGSLPRAFRTAVEESVPEGLRQGLAGWEVSDCRVIVTHSECWARQSHMHGSFDRSMSTTADDFRCLTLLVVQAALKGAGTIVCEPMHRFRLELPVDLVGLLLSALAQFGAEPHRPEPRGASYLIEGDIPAAQVHALQQHLPTLTRGEGVLESAFDHYRPVLGAVPTRPRRSLG